MWAFCSIPMLDSVALALFPSTDAIAVEKCRCLNVVQGKLRSENFSATRSNQLAKVRPTQTRFNVGQ